MPGFTTSLICLFSALALSAHGATLSAETQTTRVMRSPQSQVEINSKADFKLAPVHEKLENQDYCRMSFVAGVPNSKNECLPDTTAIDKNAVCKEAAILAETTTSHDDFVVKEDNVMPDKRETVPQGCFVAASGGRYHYNGIGVAPKCGTGTDDNGVAETPCLGTPVCSRKRYLNGTASVGATQTDSSVILSGGCANGYEVVDTEVKCRSAATCLNYCKSQHFLIGEHNATRQHEFPKGCFINTKDSSDGCVYFNNATAGDVTKPHGTNICVTTARVA